MRYKILGKSGLRVSELALGTMTFGETWGWGASKETCQAMFDAFANAGGNFIDTANRYTDGTAEGYVGDLIAADRAHFIVASKYSLYTRHGDPNASGNHRKSMVEALNTSLKRLKTDYIDIYWLHAWDYLTPIEEIMRAFDDMVRAGKVLYVGVSDTPAWVISRANAIADLRGWTPFIGLQIEYSLVQRDPERDLLPMARALDIGVTAWSPLGGGVLTGKYNRQDPNEDKRFGEGAHRVSQRNLSIAEAVGQVAEELGRPPSQVALNWVRAQEKSADGRPGVPIIPILGARKLEQFQQNLACLEFTLSPEHKAKLDKASQIDLGWPHSFLASSGIQDLVYGGTRDQIDAHRPPSA